MRYTKVSLAFLSAFTVLLTAAAADNPFLGDWALTIPGGAAGWLGVEEADGRLKASLLWGGGSVFSLESAKMDGSTLVLTRILRIDRKDATGKRVRTTVTEVLTCRVDGDLIKLTSVKPRANGQGEDKAEFTGRRQPPMPPAPDLKAAKYAQPIRLFNGRDLSGWRLTDANAINGWSVKGGVLFNNPVQEEGKPHKNYGNLRTEAEYGDFNLTLEVRVLKGQNSGIYLRGIYEVQVADTYGRGLDSHNMGAIYSRLTPTVSAEKPPGEWQTMDITLLDRHVTVILNGKCIIDNQPIRGCTGGALWSDVTRPGPLYLQGDHTGVEYRNIVLRPVVK